MDLAPILYLPFFIYLFILSTRYPPCFLMNEHGLRMSVVFLLL